MPYNTSKHRFIPSGYHTALREFPPKREAPYIIAYVEGQDDKNFWREIFNRYSPVEVKPKTNKGSADGKEAVWKNIHNTGKDIIICIDSDLNYLLPNNSEKANFMNNHICVFQTYAYTVENYRCYAQSLNELCKRISRNYPENEENEFDFEDFFTKFSLKIYEPFTYFLYFKFLKDESTIESIDFENLIKIDKSKLKRVKDIIGLKEVLDEMLEEMEMNLIQKVIDFEIDVRLKNLQIELENEREIKRSKTYLFICGHLLLRYITKPIVKKVLDIYSQEERNKIKIKYKNDPIQLGKRLNEYQKLLEQVEIEDILKLNNDFHDCYLIDKIKKDINIFINKYHPSCRTGKS